MTEDKSTPPLVIPQLIVGLGNPEPKYDQTRHNIGFMAVDALARAWQLNWAENRKFQGWFAEGAIAGVNKVKLLKPTTYMNRSGTAIRATIDWYKLPPESVLIIYDEMDLPLGKLRLRLSGSAGGHNGMKSAISHLGTQDFPRLRIGIGRSNENSDSISHVLGKLSASEIEIVNPTLDLVVKAVEASLNGGVEKAMNLYNTKSKGDTKLQT
jgi:peptidyl-tRNA hydrolase, PTH1 family